MKTAYQLFLNSAGAFQELKDDLEKHPQPNIIDLSFEAANMFINLMLAQAQEIFSDKAVKDNTNPTLVAKLYAQASEFYEIALTNLNHPSLANVVPKNWAPHLQIKSAMCKASANQLLAAVHGKSDEYGLQVARLKYANDILEDAKKKFLKNVTSDAQSAFNNLQNNIIKLFQSAEKENDTIYHDTVPANPPAIEKKAVAKPAPLPADILKLPQDKDPFYKLIPFAITEKLSIYQERKDTLVRDEMKGIDEQNQLAIGMLASMNLPGAIEALETPSGVPQAIEQKRVEMQKEGGAKLILELVDTLNKLADEDSRIMDKALKNLDDEEKEDNEMRTQWGTRWQRTPSHTLTANLRQESAKFRGNFDHARKSDAYVMKKFQDNQQFMVKLSGSANELLGAIPSNNAQTYSHPAVQSLKQSLSILDKLIAQRNSLKAEITDVSKKDDISSKLLNLATSANDGYDQFYSDELQKYSNAQNQLRQNYTEQANLLNKIQQENSQFVASKQQNNTNAQREQILQSLNTAYKVYGELKGNLREGIQFYTNFQEILKHFERKCADFAFARKTEKQDLLNEIQVQATGVQSPPQQQYNYQPPPNQPPPNQPSQNKPPQAQQPQYQAQPQYGYQQPPPQPHAQQPYQQPPPQSYQQPYQPQQPHPQQPQPFPQQYPPGFYGQAPPTYGMPPQQPGPYVPPGYNPNAPPQYQQPPPNYGYQQPPPQRKY